MKALPGVANLLLMRKPNQLEVHQSFCCQTSVLVLSCLELTHEKTPYLFQTVRGMPAMVIMTSGRFELEFTHSIVMSGETQQMVCELWMELVVFPNT